MTDQAIAQEALLTMLKEDGKVVLYRPRLSRMIGTTSAILLQQMYYRYNGKPFYKLKAPCSSRLYTVGDSWCEELGFLSGEFDTALRRISTKCTKGKNKTELLAMCPDIPQPATTETKKQYMKRLAVVMKCLIIYWTDSDHITWYSLNRELFAKLLIAIYIDKLDCAIHGLNGESQFIFIIDSKNTNKEKDSVVTKSSGDVDPLPKCGISATDCIFWWDNDECSSENATAPMDEKCKHCNHKFRYDGKRSESGIFECPQCHECVDYIVPLTDDSASKCAVCNTNPAVLGTEVCGDCNSWLNDGDTGADESPVTEQLTATHWLMLAHISKVPLITIDATHPDAETSRNIMDDLCSYNFALLRESSCDKSLVVYVITPTGRAALQSDQSIYCAKCGGLKWEEARGCSECEWRDELPGTVQKSDSADVADLEFVPTEPLEKFKVKAKIGKVSYVKASKSFDEDFPEEDSIMEIDNREVRLCVSCGVELRAKKFTKPIDETKCKKCAMSHLKGANSQGKCQQCGKRGRKLDDSGLCFKSCSTPQVTIEITNMRGDTPFPIPGIVTKKKKRKPTINVQILHGIYSAMSPPWPTEGMNYGGLNGKIGKNLRKWGATPEDMPGYVDWLTDHYRKQNYNKGEVELGSYNKEANWRKYQAHVTQLKAQVVKTEDNKPQPLSATDGVVRGTEL